MEQRHKESEIEKIAQKAITSCPLCGSELETLVLVKKTLRGSLKIRFYPSSYCPNCDAFRRKERSLKRCTNCGGNIIGVRITQPGEFCWLCGGTNLKYLEAREQEALADKVKCSDNVAIFIDQILRSMQKIERCSDGKPHKFRLAQVKSLEDVFYQLVCAKCHQIFHAYSVTIWG